MPAIMANNDYPVFDGVAPSWADVKVTIRGTGISVLEAHDIKAINTSTSLEIGYQKSGGRVIKRTVGESSQEASITLYHEGYLKLLRALKDAAPSRGNAKIISMVVFDISFQYTPPGSTEIYDTLIKGCRVKGRTLNGAEGTDATEVEVPLDVIEIVDRVDGEDIVLL